MNQFTSLEGGSSITVDGGTYTLTKLTDIDGSSLYAYSGGKLTVPNVASYQPDGYDTYLSASGNGSLLSLPGLASLTPTNYYGSTSISASAGGDVELTGLATINTSSYYSSVNLTAAGGSSLVDVPSLTTVVTYYGGLAATSGATVVLNSGLTSLDGVTVTVDGTGTLQNAAFTSLTSGGITVNGGAYTTSSSPFWGLTDIDGSSLSVQNDGMLTLPSVGTYSYSSYGYTPTFMVSGSGSSLSLPSLGSITGNGLEIEASGAGTIDLNDLNTFNVNSSGGLSALDAGSINVGSTLFDLNGVTITLDGSGHLDTGDFAEITNGGITIQGGNYSASFSNVADIDGSSLIVQNGATLSLPGVTGYIDSSYDNDQFSAQGSGSTLDLANLTSITSNYMNVAASGPGAHQPLGAGHVRYRCTRLLRVVGSVERDRRGNNRAIPESHDAEQHRACGRRRQFPVARSIYECDRWQYLDQRRRCQRDRADTLEPLRHQRIEHLPRSRRELVAARHLQLHERRLLIQRVRLWRSVQRPGDRRHAVLAQLDLG